MIYTPEITEITISTSDGDSVAVIRWVDEVSVTIQAEHIITNSKDWPDVSAAISAAIVAMEFSTREHQEKVNAP